MAAHVESSKTCLRLFQSSVGLSTEISLWRGVGREIYVFHKYVVQKLYSEQLETSGTEPEPWQSVVNQILPATWNRMEPSGTKWNQRRSQPKFQPLPCKSHAFGRCAATWLSTHTCSATRKPPPVLCNPLPEQLEPSGTKQEPHRRGVNSRVVAAWSQGEPSQSLINNACSPTWNQHHVLGKPYSGQLEPSGTKQEPSPSAAKITSPTSWNQVEPSMEPSTFPRTKAFSEHDTFRNQVEPSQEPSPIVIMG